MHRLRTGGSSRNSQLTPTRPCEHWPGLPCAPAASPSPPFPSSPFPPRHHLAGVAHSECVRVTWQERAALEEQRDTLASKYQKLKTHVMQLQNLNNNFAAEEGFVGEPLMASRPAPSSAYMPPARSARCGPRGGGLGSLCCKAFPIGGVRVDGRRSPWCADSPLLFAAPHR